MTQYPHSSTWCKRKQTPESCFCPPHPPWPLFSAKVRKREAKTQSLWHRRRPEGSVPHSSDYTICHVPNLEAIRRCVWFECTGGGREPPGRARAVSEVHMEGGTSAEGVVHHVNTLSWAEHQQYRACCQGKQGGKYGGGNIIANLIKSAFQRLLLVVRQLEQQASKHRQDGWVCSKEGDFIQTLRKCVIDAGGTGILQYKV